jgi:(R,R)-butanediol dehydrogenase/meso-butanediol dehydrogenase/diacetyl reductase
MACVGLSWPWGGLAQSGVVPDHQLTKLPDEVDDLQGALIEPAAVAAYGVDRSGITPGETLLITGAGPIGALAALYARASGAAVVISEPNPARAALARRLDVGDVIDPTGRDVPGEVYARTGGLGVHASVECSGTSAGLTACLAATRARGTVVQTGLHTKPAGIDAMELSLRDLTLAGTWCYPVTDWPRIISLVGSGRYAVERVVTSQIGLDDVVPKGFETLCDPRGDQVKVLVGTQG